MKKVKVGAGLYDVDIKERDARVFLLFIQAAEIALKCSEACFNKVGLSVVKMMVLQFLQIHGGTLTPTEIANLTLREKHDITTLIRRMERAQLISTRRSETDNRSINVTITEKGRRAIVETAPIARSIYKNLMSSVPDAAYENCEQTFKVIRQNAYDRLQSMK